MTWDTVSALTAPPALRSDVSGLRGNPPQWARAALKSILTLFDTVQRTFQVSHAVARVLKILTVLGRQTHLLRLAVPFKSVRHPIQGIAENLRRGGLISAIL